MTDLIDPVLRELEGFEVDAEIELFSIDASVIGGGVYYFAPSAVEDATGVMIEPSFGGQRYTVLPFDSEGWEFTSGGSLPQPTIRFSIKRETGDQLSAATFLMALVEEFDDLLGAQVYRFRTLRKYLDDGSEPNPQAHLGIENYEVRQRLNQNADMIEFRLGSALDLEDVMLPRRQVLNFCQWTYRIVDGAGNFDYTNATCPYVGAEIYDTAGNVVVAKKDDRCSKALGTGCKVRFGENAILPFGGFPGAGKLNRGY